MNHSHSNKFKFKKILRKINYSNLSCLDIGGSQNTIKDLIKNTKILDIKNADIKFDLIEDFIINKKLPFKKNSFDIVVISQVLEHTITPDEIFKETKRITKKYILLSLPNDLTWDDRLRFLMGKSMGFQSFGHKQVLNYNQLNFFLKNNLNGLKIVDSYNLFACFGGRFLPLFLREFLANQFPSFFVKKNSGC
jgi:SAM-dependent methyltransferase